MVDEKISLYTTEEKMAMREQELEKINKWFEHLSDREKDLLADRIHAVAVDTVELKELQELSCKNGQIERYKNGACQYGYKVSASHQAYVSLSKVHLANKKFLQDWLLRTNPELEKDDSFMDFIKMRNR